ncbi:MAG: outer membrane beta-barrel protein [Bacteroidota bacterium]
MPKEFTIQFYEPDGSTPVSYFTFQLVNPIDTTFNKKLLTDDKGQIKINLPVTLSKIKLLAKNSFFELDTLVDLQVKRKANLLVVIVNFTKNYLSEVNITAGRRTLYTAEKRSYKVSDFTIPDLPIGKNLLRMLPGISSIDNIYKVDGSFEPIFYLNGTRVLSTTIENLPTERIERVEIVKNSMLTSGLRPNQVAINLITKKDPNTIIGGILSVNNSFIQKNYGAFSTLHISSKKFFANLMINTYNAEQEMESASNWFTELNQKKLYSRSMIGNNATKPLIGTLSLNADLSDKLQLNYAFTYNNIKVNQSSQSYVSSQGIISLESLDVKFSPLNYSNFANLTLKLPKNSSIFFRVFHSINKTNTILDLKNVALQSKVLNMSNNKNQDLNLLLGYDFKLNKVKLELGSMFQQNNSSNAFEIANNTGQNSEDVLTYNQTIYSAYLKTSFPFKLFTLSINNRVDITIAKLNQNKLEARWQYLPSVNIFVPTKKLGAFTLMASRQIILPSSDDLSANQKQQTTGIISQGSNNILPQFNWSVNLTHSLSGDKFELNNALSYENINDFISYSPYLLGSTGLIERTKVNVNSVQTLSLNPSINLIITKKINFTYSMDVGYYKANYAINNQYHIINDGFFLAPSLNASINRLKWFNLGVNLSYKNNSYSPFEVKRQVSPALSLTLSRAFFKKSLNVNIAMYDILNNSNNANTTGISQTVQYWSKYHQPFRSIGMSVSYLFHAKAFRYGGGSNKGIKGRETKNINSN